MDLGRNRDDAGADAHLLQSVGEADKLVGIAVEYNVLHNLAGVLGLLELHHTEDVLVDCFKYVVVGVAVVLGGDGSKSGEGQLTLFIKVQADKVVVDLNCQQGHLGLDLGVGQQHLGDAVAADHNRAQADGQHGEHALVAVDDLIGAGSSQNLLDNLVVFVGFLTHDNVGNGVGFINTQLGLHLCTNHLDEILFLCLGNVQLLEDGQVGGDADDRLLVGHSVGLEHLVDEGCQTGHILDVAVDDDLFLQVQGCCGADPDLAVALYALDDAYVSVGNVK